MAAAHTNPAAQAARQWRQQHERAIMDEFVALLSIPNIATDRQHPAQRRGHRAMMEKRGLAPKLVSVPGGQSVVFGEIEHPAPRAPSFFTPITTVSRSTPRNGPRRPSSRRCATRRSNTAGR